MKKTMLMAALVAGAAFAQGKAPDKAAAPAKDDKGAPPAAAPAAPAAGMDMSKMGPWTRKPTNEAAAKKEIQDFIKKSDEASAKGDMEAMLATIDFPVYMATDDSKGAIEAKAYTKDEYVAMMKPFYENMPKDVKTTHKPNIIVLSDAMAFLMDDATMAMGKQKMSGKNGSLLVKVDGAWKMKVMAEAGWGGMGPPPKADAKPVPAASPTPASPAAPKK